jgi:hypothetical protein
MSKKSFQFYIAAQIDLVHPDDPKPAKHLDDRISRIEFIPALAKINS